MAPPPSQIAVRGSEKIAARLTTDLEVRTMQKGRVVRSEEGDLLPPFWLCKIGSLTGGRFDFLVGEVPYLSGPPLHVHRDQDDTFFVLEGVLTIQLGEEVVDLGPGDFATAPPGAPHTFDNIYPDRPAPKVCNLMTPGGLDSLFQDMARMGAGAAGAPTFDELSQRHGFTLVGPTLGAKLGLS
jgi:mannose-6-phosphate isomerase-like protein (cupin superfamily)